MMRALGWLAFVCVASASAVAHAAMSCSIVSTSGVAFGSYDGFSTTPLDSAGSVAFRCTGVGPADMISIQIGRGSSGSFLPRAMSRHRFRLEYNLFMDAARTIVWGDGTGGTSAYTARPVESQMVSVPIFGRIMPRQNVEAGAYGDLVVLTVLY
ncbi:MAG: spore coat U domain-containing protein [Polyangiales bacterium]